jgi:mono/diheme cytochrome c family protein
MLRPSLTVGLLTLNAAATSAARLFMKHSLLTMKLLLRLILVVAGIFVTSNSLTLSQAAPGHASMVSTSARVAVSNEVLYKQKYSKCYGADGSGETSLGRIFNAPDFTDGGGWAKHPSGETVNRITRGKKNMPAFGKKLSRAQIANLAAYVQRFKQQ